MILHHLKTASACTCVLSTLLLSTVASAQTVSPAMQALFNDAVALMKQNNFAAACRKLEVVVEQVPQGSGARMELGRCYKGEGRLASAWTQYTQAEPLAQAAGNSQRAVEANQEAAALAPLVAKLSIEVPPAIATLTGLKVNLDGVEQPPATWGTALPVDAGAHIVTSTASGRKTWATKVLIKNGTSSSAMAPLTVVTIEAPKRLQTKLQLDIPSEVTHIAGVVIKMDGSRVETAKWMRGEQIEPGPHEIEVSAPGYERYYLRTEVKVGETSVVKLENLKKSETNVERQGSMSPVRVSGIVLGGVGLVGLGVGAILGSTAISKNDESNKYCFINNVKDNCLQTGYDLRTEAITFGNASTGVLIAGGALVAVGVTLIIVGRSANAAPNKTPQASLMLGPGSLQLRGSW